MATTGKQILTTITLRNNTLENLEKSQKILQKGEVTFGSLSGDYVDQYVMKVGTGDKTWSQLSSFNIRVPFAQVDGLSSEISRQVLAKEDKNTQYQIVTDSLEDGETGWAYKLRKRDVGDESWSDVPASRFNVPYYDHDPIFSKIDVLRTDMQNLSVRLREEYTGMNDNSHDYVDQVSAWLSADYYSYDWMTRKACIVLTNQLSAYTKQQLADYVEQMTQISNDISASYKEQIEGFTSHMDEISNLLSTDYQHQINVLSVRFYNRIGKTVDYINQVSTDLSTDYQNRIDELTEYVNQISTTLSDDYQNQIDDLTDYVESISTDLSTDYQRQINNLTDYVNSISTDLSTDYSQRFENITDYTEEISAKLSTDYQNQIDELTDYVEDISTDLSTDYQGQIDDLTGYVESISTDLSIDYDQKLENLTDYVESISTDLSTDYQGQIDSLTEYVEDISTDLSTDYQGQIDSLTEYVEDISTDLSTDYQNQIDNLTEYAESLAHDLSTDYNSQFTSQTVYINSISTDLSVDYSDRINNLTDYVEDISTALSTDYQGKINDLYSRVGHAVHYKGNTSTYLSSGMTDIPDDIYIDGKEPVEGDIVIYNKIEYIWGLNTQFNNLSSVWTQIGDESSFATHEEVTGKFNEAVNSTKNTVVVYNNESDLSNLGTNTGDIAIVKTYIYTKSNGERVYQHGAYVWRNDTVPKHWEAMDGKYSAENVYFKENIKLAGDYKNVGNVKIEDGELESSGKSVKQMFQDIFQKRIQPDYGDDPTVTVSINDQNTTKEVGTRYTPSWSCSYNMGKYSTPWDGGTVSDGTTLSSFHITDSLGLNTIENTTDTKGTFSEFTLSDDNDYYVSVYAEYNDGNIAKDNMGDDSTEPIQRTHGKTETKSSGTVKARRLYFWGYRKTGETILDVTHLQSSDIRSFMDRKDNGGRNCYGFSFPSTTADDKTTNFSVPNGTRQIIFAAPHDGCKKKIAVYNNSSLGGDLSFDNSNTRVQNAVRVEGANNYYDTQYDIWYRNFTAELNASDLAVTWN